MKFNEFSLGTESCILVLVNKAEFIPLYTTMSHVDLLERIKTMYTKDLWGTMAIIRIITTSGNLLDGKKTYTEVFDIGTSIPQIEFYSRGVN